MFFGYPLGGESTLCMKYKLAREVPACRLGCRSRCSPNLPGSMKSKLAREVPACRLGCRSRCSPNLPDSMKSKLARGSTSLSAGLSFALLSQLVGCKQVAQRCRSRVHLSVALLFSVGSHIHMLGSKGTSDASFPGGRGVRGVGHGPLALVEHDARAESWRARS